MQTANALKIGVWIVIALLILIFGTKFFQGVSLKGSYQVVAKFDRVDGLIPGNMAQTKGVRIGQVKDIKIHPDSGFVLVSISVNEGVAIRQGATASLTGLAALGDVRVEIDPGPPGNPPLPNGGTIRSVASGDLIGSLTSQADGYLTKIEAILESANASTTGLDDQLNNPTSDLRMLLVSLREMTQSVSSLMRSNSDELSRTIENLESTTGNLATLTSSDSASVATELRASLQGMNATMTSLQSLTGSLDTLLVKMNAGEGTLGRLANDPSLYNHMDSVAVNLSRLLEDVRKNPKRYLGEVRIIDFL